MKPFPEFTVEDRPDSLRWRVELLDQDEQLTGMLCGDVKIVATHWSNGRSVPCRTLLTEGKLACWCANVPTPTRPTAYVPLILKDGDRVVLVTGGVTGKRVREAGSGAIVQASKPGKKFAKLKIRLQPIDSFSGTLRSAILKQGPKDIQHFLLHLWQDAELCDHFGYEFKPSEATRAALG